MKKHRKALSLLLALVLCASLCGSLVTAQAAQTNVVYSFRTREFSFTGVTPVVLGGAYASTTDLFPDLKNMMPGDVHTQQLSLKVRGLGGESVNIYLSATPAGALPGGNAPMGNQALLNLLDITVRDGGGATVFTGNAADEILLGNFQRGDTADYTVTVTVSPQMGNEFMNAMAVVYWTFAAEELDEEGIPIPGHGGNSLRDILDEEVALAGGEGGAWALVNLLCAILTLLLAAVMTVGAARLRKREKDEGLERAEAEVGRTLKHRQNKRALRFVSIFVFVLAAVFFWLTEDIRLPMVLTDRWTVWMVLIALGQLAVYLGVKLHRRDDGDGETPEPAGA